MKRENVLRNTVYSKAFGTADWTAAFSSALYLQCCRNSEVYIYGVDKNLTGFIKLLQNEGLNVVGIIGTKKSLCGKNILGVEILDVDTLNCKGRNAFCFVLSKRIDNNVCNYIAKTLKRVGFDATERVVKGVLSEIGIKTYYELTDHDKDLIFQNQGYEWDAGRQDYYQKEYDNLRKVVDLLEDEKSFEVLIEYVRTYTENDIYRGEQGLFRHKYFWGNDKEFLYEHLNNEVWVNCGAGKGETLFTFLSEKLEYSKIYCVDEDGKALSTLRLGLNMICDVDKQNIEVIQKRIDNAVDLKSMLKGRKLTLMNADIEGAELNLLKGCEDAIVEYRPVLAICVYHRREDLIEIPLYLNEKLKNYTFYLRKYVATSANKKRNGEVVFYAIPKERAVF